MGLLSMWPEGQPTGRSASSGVVRSVLTIHSGNIVFENRRPQTATRSSEIEIFPNRIAARAAFDSQFDPIECKILNAAGLSPINQNAAFALGEDVREADALDRRLARVRDWRQGLLRWP